MNYYFREILIRPLLGGIFSYIPGLYAWWDARRPTGNSASAAYAKGIWKFHIENVQKSIPKFMPKRVIEFGPGASLGSSISAIDDGVMHAIGIDVCPYIEHSSTNLCVLNELISAETKPSLNAKLTDEIMNFGIYDPNGTLQYVAPWEGVSLPIENSIDLIFSHSVLEHVSNPQYVYGEFYKWLKPGGIMSHKIDHSSHKITRSWNGHYVIPAWLWSIEMGKKPYLLNRLTPEEHRDIIVKMGFTIISEHYVYASENDLNCQSPSLLCNENYLVKTSTLCCMKPI